MTDAERHVYALSLALLAVKLHEMDLAWKRVERSEARVNAAPDTLRRAKAVVRLTLARERLMVAVDLAERAVKLAAFVQSKVKVAA